MLNKQFILATILLVGIAAAASADPPAAAKASDKEAPVAKQSTFEKYVNNKIAESRKAGESLLFSDFAPKPIPDRENAALVYKKAFKAMKLPEDKAEAEKWDDIESGDAKISDNMAFVEKILAQNAKALALIEKAARMPKCVFKRDYTGEPLAIQLPEVMPLMKAARLLNVNARFELAKGNAAAAFRWTLAALSIPRALKEDPFFVPLLIRITVSNWALESAQELLKSGKLTPKQMDKLKKAFAQQYDPGAIKLVMTCERASGFTCIKMLGDGKISMSDVGIPDPEVPKGVKPSDNPVTALWLRAEMGNYLDIMNKYVAMCDLPIHKRAGEAEKIVEELKEMKKLSFVHKATRFFVMILAPAAGTVVITDANWLALCRTGQVAIEIEKYKRREGKYPASLKPLTKKLGKTARDPFTAKPLLYKRTDKGYLVWSVGPNKADNEAKNDTQLDSGGDRDDVIWYGGGEERPRPPAEEESP